MIPAKEIAGSVAVPGVHIRRFLDNSRATERNNRALPDKSSEEFFAMPSIQANRALGAGTGITSKAVPVRVDPGDLYRRVFLYLAGFMGIFLFQIHNTLTIRELSRKNEQLRENLRMTTSVSTGHRLKMGELQSIQKITGNAAALGLSPSSVLPVELDPELADKRH